MPVTHETGVRFSDGEVFLFSLTVGRIYVILQLQGKVVVAMLLDGIWIVRWEMSLALGTLVLSHLGGI